MSIRSFKKENLHCVWDDSLLGKTVLCADTLSGIYELLESEVATERKVTSSSEISYPFLDDDYQMWRFAYVVEEPTYNPGDDEVKLSYLQGHSVMRRFLNGEWEVMSSNSYFDLPGYEYKVASDKPSNSNQIGRIVTYRELSRWLAQGNGEYCYYGDDSRCKSDCFNELRYRDEDADEIVRDIMVRKWDDTEWYNPIASYLGLEN